jgi:hypothetical protein
MAGPLVEFLAPPAFAEGSMLQFWSRGGNIALEDATRMFLEAYFDDHRFFKVKRGVGNCVFGHLWNSGDAFDLHGTAGWVGNTIICCAKVDPHMLYDVRAAAFVPVIRFVR